MPHIGKLIVLGLQTASIFGTASAYTIQWGNCSSSDPPGLDCGQLQVPLDWTEPNGEQITLGMNRLNATGKNRIGSLLYNPGGPGGAATIICADQALGASLFTDALTEHFDIICPDPRGVGTSTPVQCDPDIWNQRTSAFPTDEASYEKLVAHNKALGESCLNLTGPLLAHVDTTSAAKDIEAIRLALNDGKLNWLGESYGTQLGGAYAELYPENIRAMVLDGNLDHSQSETDFHADETRTYEDELNRFFAWCNTTDTCALHGQDVAKLFDTLVSQANKTPIPAPGCEATAQTTSAGTCQTNVTGEDIIFNVQGNGLLSWKEPNPNLHLTGWAGLSNALNDSLYNHNATLLSSAIATSNTSAVFAGLAIACLDFSHNATTFALNQYEQLLGKILSPHTLGATQSYSDQTGCPGWPVPIANPPHLLNQTAMKKAPPILLVNADHDPETSYVWAFDLLGQIPTGVLLTREGDGHTSYILQGEATAAIDACLVNGTLPAPASVVNS